MIKKRQLHFQLNCHVLPNKMYKISPFFLGGGGGAGGGGGGGGRLNLSHLEMLWG